MGVEPTLFLLGKEMHHHLCVTDMEQPQITFFESYPLVAFDFLMFLEHAKSTKNLKLSHNDEQNIGLEPTPSDWKSNVPPSTPILHLKTFPFIIPFHSFVSTITFI